MFYLFQLLSSEENVGTVNQTGFAGFMAKYGMWILLAVFVGVWIFMGMRQRKKQEQEINEKMNALKPGDKVETIGRIYGTIVSVNSDENTLVLLTGDEDHPSYVKVDKMAVYRTIVDLPPVEETENSVAEEPFESEKTDEAAEVVTEKVTEPVEESAEAETTESSVEETSTSEKEDNQ